MLMNEKDLGLLTPFMKDAVRMSVTEYPSYKKAVPVREVMLEYKDGNKMIGDLNSRMFSLRKVTGLKSIMSFFARGKYGKSSWIGNCTGLLPKEVFEYYKPKFVVDPAKGSGTVIEVCQEMGIKCKGYDLYEGFDLSTMELPVAPDFVWFHPPYFVYEGSAMPKYSGVMYGDKPLEADGSHIHDKDKFIQWFNACVKNIYSSVQPGGRIAILMGDSKYKGQYFSMLKEMDVIGELEQIIVKEQHNCISDQIKYAGKFIPTNHEFLVIIKKPINPFSVPCHIVKRAVADIMVSMKASWRVIFQSIIFELGGRATRQQILDFAHNHPKSEGNKHLDAKLRQVINMYPEIFAKDDNNEYISILTAPAA